MLLAPRKRSDVSMNDADANDATGGTKLKAYAAVIAGDAGELLSLMSSFKASTSDTTRRCKRLRQYVGVGAGYRACALHDLARASTT